MWENTYLGEIAVGSPVTCDHSVCTSQSLVLPSKMPSKNYTQKVYGVELPADLSKTDSQTWEADVSFPTAVRVYPPWDLVKIFLLVYNRQSADA